MSLARIRVGTAGLARASRSSMAFAAIVLPTAVAVAQPTTFSDQTTLLGIDTVQKPSSNLTFAPANVSRMMGAGVVADFDRDGRPDVFVLTGGSTPDQLLINGGASFTDRAAQWNVKRQHIGIGACAGDFDGDGWLDLFVVSWGDSSKPGLPVGDHHLLYRNTGNGSFVEVGEAAGLRTLGEGAPAGWGPAFGDYDLDGDLDLAVPSWTVGGTTLYRNEGDGTFTDVTVTAGMHDPAASSFSARFVDMNGDRYPELVVAGDYGTSRYWINDGDGTFTNGTVASGTGLDANGMGHAVADFDRDGRPDWFVTSIYSPNSGMGGVPGTGNFLYRNLGGDVFEVPEDAGCVDGGWGWGTEPVDVDHDGLVDLIETNGWDMPNGHGVPEWNDEPNYVYRNLGDGTFADVAGAVNLDWSGQGRGLVRTDYDRDGDQDVVVFVYDGPLKVFRNDLAPSPRRSWLRIELDTQANPRLAPDGFGARVEVRTGDVVQTHWVSGGSTFASTGELDAHFGLGSAAVIDEVRVHWNDGTVTRLEDVAANRHLTIASGLRSDVDGDGTVGFGDLLGVLVGYGTDDQTADLDASGAVDTLDLMILFENWGVSS